MEGISVFTLLCVVVSVSAMSILLPAHYVKPDTVRRDLLDTNTVLVSNIDVMKRTHNVVPYQLSTDKLEESDKSQQHLQDMLKIHVQHDEETETSADSDIEVIEDREAIGTGYACATGYSRYMNKCCPIRGDIVACD